MSSYERNTGKLVPLGTLTLGDVKDIVGKKYYYNCVNKYEMDAREILMSALDDGKTDREIILINDKWYEVLDHKTPDCRDAYCDLKFLDDGTIEFDTYHYNGGAHWTELLEHEM